MYKFDNKKRKTSNVLNVLESIKLVIQIFISLLIIIIIIINFILLIPHNDQDKQLVL